jgi:hypothetical protein
MDFDEEEGVMARWPGTSLYFKVRSKCVIKETGSIVDK